MEKIIVLNVSTFLASCKIKITTPGGQEVDVATTPLTPLPHQLVGHMYQSSLALLLGGLGRLRSRAGGGGERGGQSVTWKCTQTCIRNLLGVHISQRTLLSLEQSQSDHPTPPTHRLEPDKNW